MTFSTKIKDIRTRMGISQEKLAEIMHVSRQAVTKWESGESLPDASNLHELSRYFGVSVDSLLDTSSDLPALVMTESYDLEAVERKKGYTKKDTLIANRFDDSYTIIPLARVKKLTLLQKIIDIFAFNPGTIELGAMLGDIKYRFYLVEKGYTRLLVTITDDKIITEELTQQVDGKKFEDDGYIYTKGEPLA